MKMKTFKNNLNLLSNCVLKYIKKCIIFIQKQQQQQLFNCKKLILC